MHSASGGATQSERACRYSWVEQCSGWGVVRRWAELRTHEVTDAVIWCFVTSRECWCGGRTRSPRTTHTNDRRTTKVVAGENQMVRSLGRIAGRYPPAVAAHRASGSRGVRSRTWRPVPRTSWRRDIASACLGADLALLNWSRCCWSWWRRARTVPVTQCLRTRFHLLPPRWRRRRPRQRRR